ncbi:carbohydrate binding family 9 domain-containing protein [Spirosoma koreense]
MGTGFIRYSFIFLVFSLRLAAQTNPALPNTAQSDIVLPDTTRDDVPDQQLLSSQTASGQALIFAPSKKPRTVRAVEISDKLKIDGYLNEADWQRAKSISRFVQVDPKQGSPATFDTDVRVLYNRHFLYIAAVNRDTLGRKAIRTPNFKRDFSAMAHDHFGVVIDGFNDRRNAMTFATNPYATQRDMLSFDDVLYDIDWDGFWKVRTSRTDSGWVAEMQIPWQTLRYVRTSDSTQSWGINFYRNRRYSNELSAWSPYPRAFTSSRVAYAGLITGLKPPPPSTNVRIQPYVLISDDRYQGTEVGYGQKAGIKLGGDLKWAINPNTVLDLTFNTDFAQADVDRQVNNLTRFSVLFPERRAFFLENASLFGAGLAGNNNTGEGGSMVIQPFFSRTVGLATLPDGTSTPVPIDAGARLVYRSLNRNYGGMLIRQRGIPGSPTTDFAVARYVENVGGQNRIGGLVTLKSTHATDSSATRQNMTIALDGFFRLSQALAYNAMVTSTLGSTDNDRGVSAYSQFIYRTNQLVAWWTESLVTRNFNPAMGFVSRNDVIATTPGVYLVERGKWLPKWIRSFEPGAFMELYHKASTGYLQEAQYNFNPLWLTFQNGGNLGLFVNPTFQRLDDGDYRPLGLAIESGKYRYVRYTMMFSTDPSKKISFQFNGETGRYYDGSLNYGRASMVLAPIPHIAFTLSGELNDFRNVGSYSGKIGLYSVESRMAVNPRLQLISFFQRNTYTDKNVWNVRLAWEFQPLSFLYIVYNNGTYAGTARAIDRQQEQHIIGKLSYLKQF